MRIFFSRIYATQSRTDPYVIRLTLELTVACCLLEKLKRNKTECKTPQFYNITCTKSTFIRRNYCQLSWCRDGGGMKLLRSVSLF